MNEGLFKQLKIELETVLKSRFGIDNQALNSLVEKGQSSLKTSMLAYISKHGTKDAEDMICSRVEILKSPLRQFAIEALDKGIQGSKELGNHASADFAQVSVDTLLTGMRQAFAESGNSKDTQGICQFLGIDPIMLKMINSSVGKLFGKFMK